MATIFTKIINGEIPSAKVYEDDKFLAFLDINPITEGHTLLIPKEEKDYLFDLEDELYGELMKKAKQIAKHLEQKLGCKRVCMAVIGWEVPHVHIHLVPTNELAEMPLQGPKKHQADPEKLQQLSQKLWMG